jgi:tRNA threonylcarbamoyladenosine biosynthesis protein TsaE
MMLHTWLSDSPAATLAFGEAVGIFLKPNTCLALCGPLGSGKTQFAKGVAKGLGVPAGEPIVSPTFVLVREYAGRLPLYHLDTYRLGDAEELAALGFDEMLQTDGVVVVEWADRTREVLPNDAWWFEFSHVSPDVRQISLRIEAISPDLIRQAGDILRPIDKPESPPETTL